MRSGACQNNYLKKFLIILPGANLLRDIVGVVGVDLSIIAVFPEVDVVVTATADESSLTSGRVGGCKTTSDLLLSAAKSVMLDAFRLFNGSTMTAGSVCKRFNDCVLPARRDIGCRWPNVRSSWMPGDGILRNALNCERTSSSAADLSTLVPRHFRKL